MKTRTSNPRPTNLCCRPKYEVQASCFKSLRVLAIRADDFVRAAGEAQRRQLRHSAVSSWASEKKAISGSPWACRGPAPASARPCAANALQASHSPQLADGALDGALGLADVSSQLGDRQSRGALPAGAGWLRARHRNGRCFGKQGQNALGSFPRRFPRHFPRRFVAPPGPDGFVQALLDRGQNELAES